MLKFRIDKEAFEALDEKEQALYKEEGEGYQLEVEGAVDRNKVGEFRDKNIELNKQIDKFKGVDIEKYNLAIEAERKIREESLIKNKDFDTLVNERLAVERNDYQAQIDNLTGELKDTKTNHSSLISKHEIEGAAIKAFTHHKISPDASDAVMAQVKAKFVINGGVVVAMSGENIETGANGNLTVDEFVASMPEIFKIQSKGGNGQGGNGNGVINNTETSSVSKISSGLSKLIAN